MNQHAPATKLDIDALRIDITKIVQHEVQSCIKHALLQTLLFARVEVAAAGRTKHGALVLNNKDWRHAIIIAIAYEKDSFTVACRLRDGTVWTRNLGFGVRILSLWKQPEAACPPLGTDVTA